MLTHLLFVSDNLGNLVESTVVFAKHLEELHASEMYYGDATLQNLIKHSRALIEEMNQFSEVYNLIEETDDTYNYGGDSSQEGSE